MLMRGHAGLKICLIMAVLVGFCASSPAAEQRRKTVLNPAHCRHLSEEQQRWLPREFQPYLEYTRVCVIQNSKSETVVLLVSVHADLYYKAQAGQSLHQVEMPAPLLFLPSGEVSGSLPYNFPDDPPAELRVTFAQWEGGFPERIELYLIDPRAGGNRSLPPLVWDASQKKFVSKEKGTHG
jgi:hypothetical protein